MVCLKFIKQVKKLYQHFSHRKFEIIQHFKRAKNVLVFVFSI